MQNKWRVNARCAAVPLYLLDFGPRPCPSCSSEGSQEAGACWQNAHGVQPIGFWPSSKSTVTRRREMNCSSKAIHQQAKEGRDQQLDKWCLSHFPFLFASSVFSFCLYFSQFFCRWSVLGQDEGFWTNSFVITAQWQIQERKIDCTYSDTKEGLVLLAALA